ncbi:MAG TPA: 50S ribosomal protein L29 [Acidobacteriota bacterium]|nr:50S ribosomal protein L29 [Acidobacteriota bacterium]
MLKARDLREETLEELKKRVSDMEDQLMKLRFQKATGQIDDVHKIRNVGRDLARVLTVINEKRRSAAAQEVDNA